MSGAIHPLPHIPSCCAEGLIHLYFSFILTCVIIVHSSVMFKSQPTFQFILLKTMDRLVCRYLREEALALVPLHPNQKAYQAGISVETALVRHGVDHTIVLWIRATLEGRMAAVTLNVSSMRTTVSRGCPQVCCGCFCGALLLRL
jgi:hypothetical protein